MNMIALDIATKCGWATNTSSGMWDLKPRHGESVGMRVIRFKSKILELVSIEKPDIIGYERPSGRNSRAIQVQSEMIGVLFDICHSQDIEYCSYIPSEIKRHATGKGNSGKPLMVSTAEKKWPNIDIVDDNHADALWLLDLMKTRLV